MTNKTKYEMEKNRGDAAPHPLDASSTANGGGFERFEGFESSKGCQSEQEGGSDQREQPLASPACRRNFWIELFKSAAKIAGVVLAALGLSSFNEEN